MGQDEVTQRIIEEGSVSLQESSQNSPAMAAEGQGGAGQLLCSQAPLLAPRGRSWLENSSDGWDLMGEHHGSVSRDRGMESMAAPSQGKDPSDHFDSLLIAANRFFCPHGLVLVTLTEGG